MAHTGAIRAPASSAQYRKAREAVQGARACCAGAAEGGGFAAAAAARDL